MRISKLLQILILLMFSFGLKYSLRAQEALVPPTTIAAPTSEPSPAPSPSPTPIPSPTPAEPPVSEPVPVRWKANKELLRACIERPSSRGIPSNSKPSGDIDTESQLPIRLTEILRRIFISQRSEATAPSTPSTPADPGQQAQPEVKPPEWPMNLTGNGNLQEVIQGAQKQIQVCNSRLKSARLRNLPHELTKTVKVGSCSLVVGEWCQDSAKIILEIALKLAAIGQDPSSTLSQAELYLRFLAEVKNHFDHSLMLGPKVDARGAPVDPETNVLMTSYYSPNLEASRRPDEEFKYALYSPPKKMRRVPIDSTSQRRGWRVPDGKGGWIKTFTRSEIEGEKNLLAGNELLYLKDPLERNDLQLEGSGLLRVREPDGQIRIRRLHFAADNGYANYPLGKIVRCELEQRGSPFTELHQGKARVKPSYLGGKGLRSYLQNSESPTWSKLFELIEETDSLVFFRETENKGAEGLYGLTLTPNVSLASDQSAVPFGFPVVLSGNKEGQKSFLGFSQDTGGVIRGAHFDVYIGEDENAKYRAFMKTGVGRVLIPKNCGVPPNPISPLKPGPP